MEANGFGFGVNLHLLPYLSLEGCLESGHCPEQYFLLDTLVDLPKVFHHWVGLLASLYLLDVVPCPLVWGPR